MLDTFCSNDPSAVEALIPEWQHASDKTCASLYVTPEWVLSLWESHFGKTGIDFVVDREVGQLRSVFPLHRRKLQKFGIQLTQVELLTNIYGKNHNDLACFPVSKRAIQQYLDAVDLVSWDTAYIASVPDESCTKNLLVEEAAIRGHTFSIEANVKSPYLPLPPDWDAFLASKSTNFRADMRRKWSKATAAGLAVRVISDALEVPAALEVILQIEASSWKEWKGTSISAQEAPLRFYKSFLPRAARMGWLRLYLVYAGDQPIAYDMGVLLRGRYYMLKTSFASESGRLSPGIYLRQYVIKNLMEIGGVIEHDFLGDADPYKLRWTTLERRHINIVLYNHRSLRARALDSARRIRGHFKSHWTATMPEPRKSSDNLDS